MKRNSGVRVFHVVVVFVLLLDLVSAVVTQTRHAEAASTSVPATPPVSPLVNAAPLAPTGGVVGSGTPASCTEAALNAALAGGDAITFNCGTSPVTLTLTSQKTIAVPTSIDGGGLIALSGGNTVRLFSVSAGTSLSLANLTITQGRASGDSGGGVYNQGALTITNARFVGNVADSFGGAILNYGALELSDSTLIGNQAGINGGGIDTTALVTVTHSAFISNTAGFRGGAINNYLGSLAIVQGSFVGNSSNGYGGGVTNDAGVGSILGSSFINNTTQGFGGGLRNSGNLFIGDTTFSNNYAADKGGGLENSATLAVENLTFSGNSATNSGGGIENSTAATATVTNGTFVTNTSALSTGGGNLTNNGLFRLKNTIVAYGNLFDCAGTFVSLGYNLYGGAACAPLAPGDIQTTDPTLGPLQDNGGPTLTHAPLPGSPVMDRIPLVACPPTDQRGLARPQGSLCDIGAVEQLAPLPVVSTMGAMPWQMLGHDLWRSGRGNTPGPQDAVVLTTTWPYRALGRIETSPAIDYNDTAYFGADDALLYAVDRNGARRFTFRTGGAVRSSPALVSVGSALGVEAWTPPLTSTIYFGSDDGKVYAVDSTGALEWSLAPGAPPNTSPVRSSPAAMKLPNSPVSRVYVGADSGKLYAIFEVSSTLATTAWEITTGMPLTTSPALSPKGDIVYAGGTDGKLYCLDATTGVVTGTLNNLGQGALTTPVVDPAGNVYVGTAAGSLLSFDRLCQPRKYWNIKLPGSVTAAPALGVNGQVVVIAGNALHTFSHFGNLLWSQPFGRPVGRVAPIVDSSGVAYVASDDGWLYAVMRSVTGSGAIKWGLRVEPSGSTFLGQPALDSYGRIYLGASDNLLDVIDDAPDFQIAFHSDISATANLDIYSLRETYGIVNPARTMRLTENVAAEHQPAYSLDRSVMAYVSNRQGNDDVFLADAVGSNEADLTLPRVGAPFGPTSAEVEPAFTAINDMTGTSRLPDGKRYLALTTNASGLNRIAFVDLGAYELGSTRVLSLTDWATRQGAPLSITAQLEPPDKEQSGVAFSPDGVHAAWRDCAPATNTGTVRLLTLSGITSTLQLVDSFSFDPETRSVCHDSPTFSPDNQWLAVREGNNLAVYGVANPAQPAFVTPAPSGMPTHPNWAPDGSEIAVGVTATGTVDLSAASGFHYAVYSPLTSSGTSDEPYYHYFKLPPPQAKSVSPDRQYPGDLIRVYGRGFDILHPLDNQVYFTDTLHTTWLAAEVLGAAVDPRVGLGVLTVRVPDLAGNGPISITTRFGSTATPVFYVLPKPISIVQPRSVPGANVRVFGVGFDLRVKNYVLFQAASGGWITATVSSGYVSGQQEVVIVEVQTGIAETGIIRAQNDYGGRDCPCTFTQLHPTFTIQRTTGLPAYAQQGCDGIPVSIAGTDFPYDSFFGYGLGSVNLLIVNTAGTPVPMPASPAGQQFGPTGSDTAGFGPSVISFPNLGPNHPGGDLDVQARDGNLPAAIGHAPFRVPLRNLPIIFVAGTGGVSLDTPAPFTYNFPGDYHSFPWECRACAWGSSFHYPKQFAYNPGLVDPMGPRIWLGPEAINALLAEIGEIFIGNVVNYDFNRANHYMDVLAFDSNGANTLYPQIHPGSVLTTVNILPNGVAHTDPYRPIFDYLLNTLGRPYNTGANGVYPFLYDWRADMGPATTPGTQAAALGAFVNQVLASTGAPKVVLITHSLGGPVARSYYLTDPSAAAKVDQVISMGGGFGGVPKPVKILEMGDKWLDEQGYGVGSVTVLSAGWEAKDLAENWGTVYFQSPNSDLWFADDVIRGGAYDRRYIRDGRLFVTSDYPVPLAPVDPFYTAHMNWIKAMHNATIAARADNFFQSLTPSLGDFYNGTGPIYHQRIFSLGLDTPGGVRLFTAPSALCTEGLLTGNPLGLFDCYFDPLNPLPSLTPILVTWREPPIVDGDGTVAYHGLLGLTSPYDDRTYVLHNIEHLDMTKQTNTHDLIGGMLSGTICSQPQAANLGFLSHTQVEEGYKVPPSPAAAMASEKSANTAADHWLLRVRGTAGVDITDAQGRHDGVVAANPVLLEHNIPGIYSNPGDSFSYVSITAPGNYTVTLSGTIPTALDIYLTPSAGSAQLDTTFFQGVPLTSTSKAYLELNTTAPTPTLELDYSGNGALEPISVTANLDPHASADYVPPTTTISIANVTVTLTATDNPGGAGVLRTYYSTDAGGFQVYTGTFTVPPGVTRITAFSVDRNGNFEAPFVTKPVSGGRIYLPLVIR